MRFFAFPDPMAGFLTKPTHVKCMLSGMVVGQSIATTPFKANLVWLWIIDNWSDVMLLRIFLHAKDSQPVESAL